LDLEKQFAKVAYFG